MDSGMTGTWRPELPLKSTAHGRPIYLSTNSHARHGHRQLSIRVHQSADINSFLFDQLGMRLKR